MSFRRSTIGAILLGVCPLLFGEVSADAQTFRTPPVASRALIVSIDGLRPDLLLRANTPTLRGLMKRGSFTMWARTTAVAVTLPSHVSMLTGVAPEKHGITWNSSRPSSSPIYPAWPTLFELARRAGRTTAMAAGKSKMATLDKPGTLDWAFSPEETVIPDRVVADTALAWVERHSPQVLFVHLPEVDTAGHRDGWGSAGQIAAIEAADGYVGRILDALERRGVLDSTVVLISADHGGAGVSHGANDVRSGTIPWIVAGPGICANLDLTSNPDLEVRTEDTFATICYLLRITPPKPIDGRPVATIRCGDRRP